jgi:hypothetical protein
LGFLHAKSSDFAAYEPRAVDFDPRTFTYDLDPPFPAFPRKSGKTHLMR